MKTLIPTFAVDRPVTVLMGFLALLVLGLVAWTRVPLQLMPEGFEPRFLWMSVPILQGSPIENDTSVYQPLHDQLATLPHLERISATVGDSTVNVQLSFKPSIRMDDAYNETVDRIERALPDLPEDVRRYRLFKFNPSAAPLLWAGLILPPDVEDPTGYVENRIIPLIERTPGVARVQSFGAPATRVIIDFDRERLLAHGVNISEVQRRLATDNFQLSGGSLIDDGQVWRLRSTSFLPDLNSLRAWPVRPGLTLSDIADVDLRVLASADIDRLDGQEGIVLVVSKEANANTVGVAAEVRQALKRIEDDEGLGGPRSVIYFDQGEVILSGMTTLRNAALTGGVLAVFVLGVFLRSPRMVALIAASIPFCLLVVVGILYARGSSLNLIAMLGLLLAVGMVVDNAIVVVESIWRRLAAGEPARTAAIEGTGEVGLAITASTATSMVVFLPVILMTDDVDVSFFLGVLGFPVVFALGASLLTALVLAPLATRLVALGDIPPEPRWLTRLTRAYQALLDATLRRRADATAALGAMAMLTIFVAVPGVGCNPSSVSEADPQVVISFTAPTNVGYGRREAIVRAFEDLVDAHRDAWGVRFYQSTLGADAAQGSLTIHLDPEDGLDRDEVAKALEPLLPTEIAGVRATIGWGAGAAGDERARITLNGDDYTVLFRIAEQARQRLRTVPGVRLVEIEDERGQSPEIQLRPQAEALRRYGLTAQTVGQTVAFAMRGNRLPEMQLDGRRFDVESRLSIDDRGTLAELLDFPVGTPDGTLVPLRATVDDRVGTGPAALRRVDGRTSVELLASLEDDARKDRVQAGMMAALNQMAFPRGYGVSTPSWDAEALQRNSATLFAMLMSIVFVYLLMGVLFESWLLPISVLITIPLALLGAWWGLFLTGTELDVIATLGLVVLVGVVVNNGIVLVDLIASLRRDGMTRDDAIREACYRRFRPILMTAATTVVGLVPMAAGTSDFAGIPYAPLGRIVIGGMVASTVLTLVFVPYLYTLLDDLRASASRWFAALGRPA